ncbi:MAG: MBL fold metallo-hydrolase [Sphingobium sp.]
MTTTVIGRVELRRVEEFHKASHVGHITPDADLVEANRHWLAPLWLREDGSWQLTFQSWILIVGGRVIVIDPCNGNARPHCQPWFDHLDFPYIERFAATGVRPEDVDFVFCTHMHHDHCGWNTHLRNGRWVPTFPNARYLFARREYERWDSSRPGYRHVDYNEGIYERSILPVMEAGLTDLIGDRHKVLDGLTIEAAPGHTLGHSLAHLVSDRAEALFSGDAFHHPLQLVRPEIQFGDCDDVEQAIATRRALVKRAAATGALIIPAHLPAPHCLRISRGEEGFVFSAGA